MGAGRTYNKCSALEYVSHQQVQASDFQLPDKGLDRMWSEAAIIHSTWSYTDDAQMVDKPD